MQRKKTPNLLTTPPPPHTLWLFLCHDIVSRVDIREQSFAFLDGADPLA